MLHVGGREDIGLGAAGNLILQKSGRAKLGLHGISARCFKGLGHVGNADIAEVNR